MPPWNLSGNFAAVASASGSAIMPCGPGPTNRRELHLRVAGSLRVDDVLQRQDVVLDQTGDDVLGQVLVGALRKAPKSWV